MNWNDRIQVQKGNLGEELVEQYLAKKGFVVYRPITGPHPFDRLCASADKRRIFVAEIKTKPRRKYYPDTGFNQRHNQDYLRIAMQHSMDVFVYFVDEVVGKIYGGELISNLHKPRQIQHGSKTLTYPWSIDGIIYFPLSCMEVVAELPRDERARLAALSSGSNAQGSLI